MFKAYKRIERVHALQYCEAQAFADDVNDELGAGRAQINVIDLTIRVARLSGDWEHVHPGQWLVLDRHGQIMPAVSPESFASLYMPIATEELWPELSERERLVAVHLTAGATRGEIAKTLGISEKTADTHRHQVLKKLKIRNAVELCVLAHRRGYL